MVGAAAAQTPPGSPVYDPASRSYFELVRIGPGYSIRGAGIEEISWERAQQFASRRVYKGARGRLAIVRSRETHEFITTKLRSMQAVWIGLRYFCAQRTLMWTDGSTHPTDGFKVWARNWNNGLGCRDRGAYAPVFYNLEDGVHRWMLQGIAKELTQILVEYPTGQP